MLNLISKRIILALSIVGLGLSVAGSLFASESEYCVRVYCKKDTATKLKTAEGHGEFYPAVYKDKTYYMQKNIFKLLADQCGNASADHLWGTNAKILESLTKWETIKPAPQGVVVAPDPQCQAMER